MKPDEAAGASPFLGMPLGCGLLGLLHLAAFGLAAMISALSGAPSGDVGLAMFGPMVFLLVFPVVQLLYASIAAGLLLWADRKPMALGVMLGSMLTLLLAGGCEALFFANFSYHP